MSSAVSYPFSSFMLANLVLVAAQRSATVHEVQPSARDRVHTIWLNGPTFSSKVAGSANSFWPSFQDDSATRCRRRSSNLCSLSPRRLEPCHKTFASLRTPPRDLETLPPRVVARSGSMCAVLDDTRYTGYDEDGSYCKAASPALDEEAHLLLHTCPASRTTLPCTLLGPPPPHVLPPLGPHFTPCIVYALLSPPQRAARRRGGRRWS